MNKKHSGHKRFTEINIVPYIDVMLVLLIIFMATASLLMQGVKVNLAHTTAKPFSVTKLPPIIVSVDKYGSYYLNIADHPQSPIDIKSLVIRVTAALRLANQRQILVKGDKAVDYGQVIRVMSILQAAGANKVGLITAPIALSKR